MYCITASSGICSYVVGRRLETVSNRFNGLLAQFILVQSLGPLCQQISRRDWKTYVELAVTMELRYLETVDQLMFPLFHPTLTYISFIRFKIANLKKRQCCV
jgi:hypothetical protein